MLLQLKQVPEFYDTSSGICCWKTLRTTTLIISFNYFQPGKFPWSGSRGRAEDLRVAIKGVLKCSVSSNRNFIP